MNPSPGDVRVQGIVLGLLAGDALGAPFQSIKGGHVRQLLGRGPDSYLPAGTVLFPDRPEKNRLSGLHTIIGQEFLAVLAGAADDNSGRSPLARGAAHLIDLAGEGDTESCSVRGALRTPGRPLRCALDRWKESYPWELADHFAPDEFSEGAGPCARGIAAWLVGADPIDAARLTHLREPSLAAAWTMAEAARLLSTQPNPRKIDAESILRELTASCRACEDRLRDGAAGERWRELEWGRPLARLSDALAPLASLLRENDDVLAEKTLLRQAREFSPAQDIAHVQHGFAMTMVPWVLYRALGPLALARAVEDALDRGGETPLAAAMIGALMGARYGVEQIPAEWIGGLRCCNVARALVGASPLAVEDWLGHERRWTAEEEAFREPIRCEADRRRTESAPKKKPKPDAAPVVDQGELPFAPPPQVWLDLHGDELAPWEKHRLKAERGRKRIDWKETRREKQRKPSDKDQ